MPDLLDYCMEYIFVLKDKAQETESLKLPCGKNWNNYGQPRISGWDSSEKTMTVSNKKIYGKDDLRNAAVPVNRHVKAPNTKFSKE